jgi:hypothetical protein
VANLEGSTPVLTAFRSEQPAHSCLVPGEAIKAVGVSEKKLNSQSSGSGEKHELLNVSARSRATIV